MMKDERFSYNCLSVTDHRVITLKGNIQGREVNVAINPSNDKNYININLANQLLIPELSISVKKNIFDQNKYKISDLQVMIGHYDYISQFHVVRMDRNTDIILGQPWFKDLGTFMLNIKKQVLTFPYKGKLVMFRDITSKSKSIKSSLEDLKYISDLMFQDNEKTISKKQKELEEFICSRDKEIACLRDHQEKLLEQVKKAKASKKELKEHLSEREDETLCLKNLNKNLLEQIKDLKDENFKIQNTKIEVDKSEIKELLRLKNHNQSLLTQIKKLKHEKKALKDKLEEFTQEEASESPVVVVQVESKGTNTDPVNMTTQEDKLVE